MADGSPRARGYATLVMVALVLTSAGMRPGLALESGSGVADPGSTDLDTLVVVFGSVEHVEAIGRTHGLKAVRLHPYPVDVFPRHDLFANDFPKLGPAVAPSSEQRREVIDTLLDSSIYSLLPLRSVFPPCGFHPAVGFELRKDIRRTEIALCFRCDLLRVYHEGRVVGSASFEPGRGRIVRLCQKIFAADEEIQALPVRRPPLPSNVETGDSESEERENTP